MPNSPYVYVRRHFVTSAYHTIYCLWPSIARQFIVWHYIIYSNWGNVRWPEIKSSRGFIARYVRNCSQPDIRHSAHLQFELYDCIDDVRERETKRIWYLKQYKYDLIILSYRVEFYTLFFLPVCYLYYKR